MATRVLDLRGLVVKVVSSEGTLQLEGDADLEIFLCRIYTVSGGNIVTGSRAASLKVDDCSNLRLEFEGGITLIQDTSSMDSEELAWKTISRARPEWNMEGVPHFPPLLQPEVERALRARVTEAYRALLQKQPDGSAEVYEQARTEWVALQERESQ